MKRGNEVSVGILITVAVIVLVLGTLFLVRGRLSSGYPLYTRFAWGQNLKQGQPVLLAGVNVGYVGDVQLRRAGYLDVLIKVNDEYKVPKGSTATVKAIGIFGDVAVALTPPIPTPAQDLRAGRYRTAWQAGGRRRPDHESCRLDQPDDTSAAHGAQGAARRRRHAARTCTSRDRVGGRALRCSLQTSIAEQNRNAHGDDALVQRRRAALEQHASTRRRSRRRW